MSNNISKTALRLLASHHIFILGRFLFNIFFNVLIWDKTESLTLLAIFNIVSLAVHMVSFHTCARFVKKGYSHLIRSLGLLGLILLFFWIFSLKDTAVNYMIIIAIMYGIFNAMYWMSYHVIRFDLTTFKNRANFTGTERAMTITVRLVAPVLGGFIIVQNFFGWAYANLFALGGVLYIIALFVGNVKLPVHQWTTFHFWESAKILWKDRDMKKAILSFMFANLGFRGALEKVLIILIFDVLHNEFYLGGWLSAFSVLAVVVSFVFGKYVPYKRYKTVVSIAGSFLFLSILMLVGFPLFVTYIIFGFAMEVLAPLIIIPQRIFSENLLHRIKDYNKHRVELLVFREWFAIGFGRLMSYVLLLFVVGLTGPTMKVLLVFMALLVPVTAYLLTSIHNDLDTAE